MSKGVLHHDGQGCITLQGAAPLCRDDLAHYIPSGPAELYPTGILVDAADDAGRTLPDYEVVVVAGPQPANPANESHALQAGKTVIVGPCLLAARRSNAGPLGDSPRDPIGFHRFANAEAVKKQIGIFQRTEPEPETTERHNLGQLESYLRFLCDSLQSATQEKDGLIRFITHDELGNESGARNFRFWNYLELRRWALDQFDALQTVYFDGLLRRPLPLGSHEKSLAIATLIQPVTAANTAPDFTLYTPAGDTPLQICSPLNDPPKKGSKAKLYPLPGLPVFTDNDEMLVTWEQS